MPLPTAWTDQLFARLSLRYGAAFLRQWPDADVAAVKADWGAVLDHTPAEAIAHALRYLPSTLPLNALQFRDLCRQAPRAEPPRLEPPPMDRHAAAAALAAAKQVLQAPGDGLTPAEQRVRRIHAIAASRGGRLSIAQRHVLEACMRQVERQQAGNQPADGAGAEA